MKSVFSISSLLKTPPGLFAAAGLVLVSLGFALQYSPSNNAPSSQGTSGSHLVVIRGDGFSPQELTIQKGDTVTFVTELDKEFWPASDPHPVHANLPAFDPQRPIAPDSSWSFSFQELGVHYYHNHLSPLMKGKIVVLEEGSGNVAEQALENCEELQGSAFDACIYQKVERVAEEEGVDAAFNLFKETYAAGANLVCHWTAHLIGEVAFEEYQKGHLFDITNETSYCGYGFYHGFMELLLRETPDPALAVSFCEDVREVLGEEGRDNCYHGIGHGFTEDPPPSWTWGDGMAMAQPSLNVCELLLGDQGYKWEACATGAFTVVAGFHFKDKHGLSINEQEDPFRFCREAVPERYQTACLGEFAPKLDKVLNWDVTRIPQVVAGIEDDRGREYAIRAVVGGMLQRDTNDESRYEKYATGCRTFSLDHDREACLKGAVWGFWLHGVPEQQYKRILAFCGLEEFTSEERSLCYETAFERFGSSYDAAKLQTVCQGVPAGWRDSCLNPPKLEA